MKDQFFLSKRFHQTLVHKLKYEFKDGGTFLENLYYVILISLIYVCIESLISCLLLGQFIQL